MKTGKEGMKAEYVRDGRLAAYVYTKTKSEAFAQAAVDSLLGRRSAENGRNAAHKVAGSEVVHPVDEWAGVGTNGSAQQGLEKDTMLGMIGDRLPAKLGSVSSARAQPDKREEAGAETPSASSPENERDLLRRARRGFIGNNFSVFPAEFFHCAGAESRVRDDVPAQGITRGSEFARWGTAEPSPPQHRISP